MKMITKFLGACAVRPMTAGASCRTPACHRPGRPGPGRSAPGPPL